MRATESPYRARHAEASGSEFTGAAIMREGIIRALFSARRAKHEKFNILSNGASGNYGADA
jgi:hypothetical protein